MKKFIDSFYLLNIKRHKEISQKVNGKHFALVGKNGAGKTTVFQGIRRLVGSLPDAEKPDIWIKKGEREGTIRIVMGAGDEQYVVEEKMTEGKRSRIKLWRYAKDKKDELTPAQSRLEEIFGRVMDFTPLMDMEGPKQFEYLRGLLNIDISGYKLQRKLWYEERTQEGQLRDTAKAALINPSTRVTDSDKLSYTETKKLDTVMSKRKEKEALTAAFILEHAQKQVNEIPLLMNDIASTNTDIKNLELRLKQLRGKLTDQEKRLAEIKAINLDKLQADVDEIKTFNEGVDNEIKTVNDHNIMVKKVTEYELLEQSVEIHSKNYQGLTQKIADLDAKLNTSLSEIALDEIYPGLALEYREDEGKIGLFLDGLPFRRNQLSYGAMIKAIIKLSVKLNEDGLSFIYIADWNLLDEENQQDLLQFAEAHENVQLGIEKVGDKTELGIEIIEILK